MNAYLHLPLCTTIKDILFPEVDDHQYGRYCNIKQWMKDMQMDTQGLVMQEVWRITMHWWARERDDVMAVGQRQAIAAPENAHRRAHLPGPLAGACAVQHLAAAQMVDWYNACAIHN